MAATDNSQTKTEEKATNNDVSQLSIQERVLRESQINAFPSTFWFSSKNDNELISPWWSPGRDLELREFVIRPSNDILVSAVSSMIKKFKSMNWVIDGPLRVVNKYKEVLDTAEFWQGWENLVSKTIQDYLTQDKGGYWELLGEGNPDGPIVGSVRGIAHLDSQYVQLTGDIEYPVIFHSTKDNKPHKLHATRVEQFVDMPSPSEDMNNVGFCAVSRVVKSSEILLKITKYKDEKLSDLPEAGLLLLNNILPEKWNDATADYQRERRRLNQEIWANIMVMFGLDPAQPATAELLNFANLPDAFDELTSTNIYINIVAMAFGVDVREFWPITSGALGTATESEVMHQKARGKGVGDIISMLERAINWKILPQSATFAFDFKDDEEDLLSAEINQRRTDTIMSMWKPGNEMIPAPVSALEIRQMLADSVSYFKEEFLEVDITPEEQATDIEVAKRFGRQIAIDRHGNKSISKTAKSRLSKLKLDKTLTLAVENLRNGIVSAESVAEFALGELIDRYND